MTIIERSIFIEDVPEAIAAVTEDARRLPEWFTGVEKVETDGRWSSNGHANCTRTNEISIEQSLNYLKALVEGT